jgi:DNA-binding beta-propeller fold protein YncE
MMWRKSAKSILLAMTFAGLWMSGCGGSGAANQVVVTVTGTASIMIPTQTQTVTSTVTGATDVSSTFDCSYTTTPNPTTAVPNPKASTSAECSTATFKDSKGNTITNAVGVLSNVQNTSTTVASTATFTAPAVFPDQTQLPNVVVTIKATSNSNKNKSGTFNITFDSGIRISLTPPTATLGTTETQEFIAKDFNGIVIPPDQLTWGVTFEVTAKIASASCSGGSNDCGSITTNASGAEVYTAPASVPAAAPTSTTTPVNAAGIVTVFAYSKIDNARIAQSAVTIVKAGDITYSGFSPTVAPQGGLQQDIFLAATNATSQLGVTVDPTDSNCTAVPGVNTIDPSQIKVVFAPGTTSASIGARVRLNTLQHPDQLKNPGFYQVQVSSSNTSIKVNTVPPNSTFCLQIVPVRPTIVSSSPDNFEESQLGQTTGLPFVIDGGFFGPPDAPTIAANFDGQPLLANNSPSANQLPTPRRINSFLPPAVAGGPFAGLFPVSVTYRTTPPAPFVAPNPASAFGNMAVTPDYGGSNPPIDIVSNNPLTLKPVPQPPPPNPPKIYNGPASPLLSFGASSVPSAIAMDPTDGLAIVTLAGATTNNVQYIDLTGSTPAVKSQFTSGGNLATGVAVDDQLVFVNSTPAQSNLAAVVNYESKSLAIMSVPAGNVLATLDLSCVIPQTDATCKAVPEPFPYSVGIDPFAHRAVVAFASTNVGLLVNLNSDPNVTKNLACLPSPPTTTWTLPYCPINFITLNTGTNPQVAFESGARLTYVTPGGAGLLSAVDLANPSAGPPVDIVSATRASNAVTVTTKENHNLDPSNPGTVLISGLPLGSTSKTDFNGSFSVSQVLDATHFQYVQSALDDTTTCTATCKAGSGTPFLTYSISPAIVGIAFNPITRFAVLADPNATSSQITFIDPKSQLPSSMSLFSEQTGPATTGVPELGVAEVAFQPFTNTAVVFNPKTNEVSLIDPTISQRPAIVTTGQNGLACFTAAGAPVSCTSTNPAPSVTIYGAIAVEPVSNLVLTLSAGSGTLTGFKLGTIKPVHIQSVLTPAIDDSTVATPANLSPAAKITLGAAPKAIGPVKILGSGFNATPLQVRLDGNDVSALGATVTIVSSHEIDVTFPATVPGSNPPVPFFSGPHHFALDVVTSAPAGLNNSNVVDFFVIEEIPLAACNVTTATPPTTSSASPGGVAIDEVHNLAVVTNTGSGCNQVSVFSLAPANIFNQTVKTIATGSTPTGVAVLPSLAYIGQRAGTSGVAVVTNNGSNTVSLIDLVNGVPVADNSKTPPVPIVVNVGTAPSGVAIDQETNLAVVANTSSNTVSTIDLTPIAQDPSNSSKTIGALTPNIVAVDQNPIAIAIDPDRGTNGRGLAVVTCLQLNGASAPFGALDAIDIGGSAPVRSSSASTSFLTATPTGVVFDPSVVTGTTNPGLFYAVSTQGNVITTFNPDSTQTNTIKVGINPSAIAYNFQTATILTVNSLSNTISIVDSQTFATKATLGIGATSKFAAAIQTFTNLAVIADQANNRVILFPLPK